MLSLTNLTTRFARDERGTTSIEYGLIAMLIAVAILGALSGLGGGLGGSWGATADKITNAMSESTK